MKWKYLSISIPEFFDWLLYRFFGRKWGKLRGHSFHRSTFIWLIEDGQTHTRCTFLLPRSKDDFPDQDSVTLVFEIYDLAGKMISSWKESEVPLTTPFIFDSKSLKGPIEGALLVKLILGVSDEEFNKKTGMDYTPTHTYIDYYKEGSYITTLHDYSAFFPDQVFQFSHVGMIPVYCTDKHETFIIIHATSS